MEEAIWKAISNGSLGTATLGLLFWIVKSYRETIADNTKAVLLMGKTLTRVADKLRVQEAGDDQ